MLGVGGVPSQPNCLVQTHFFEKKFFKNEKSKNEKRILSRFKRFFLSLWDFIHFGYKSAPMGLKMAFMGFLCVLSSCVCLV